MENALCRETQFKELSGLITKNASDSKGTILIQGRKSTGKTKIINQFLKKNSIKYTSISSNECITTRILFERIIKSFVNTFFGYDLKSCTNLQLDSFNSFKNALEILFAQYSNLSSSSNSNSSTPISESTDSTNISTISSTSNISLDSFSLKSYNKTFVIVLDKFDQMKEINPDIYFQFSRFREISQLNFITFLLVISSPTPKTFITARIPIINFPQYTYSQCISILTSSQPFHIKWRFSDKDYTNIQKSESGTNKPGRPRKLSHMSPIPIEEYRREDKAFWNNYINLIVEYYSPFLGFDVNLLYKIAVKLWPIFTKPIDEGTATSDNFVKVYRLSSYSLKLEEKNITQLAFSPVDIPQSNSKLESNSISSTILKTDSNNIITKSNSNKEKKSNIISNNNQSTSIQPSKQIFSKLAKYILCAAFLASYIPPRADSRLFGTSSISTSTSYSRSSRKRSHKYSKYSKNNYSDNSDLDEDSGMDNRKRARKNSPDFRIRSTNSNVTRSKKKIDPRILSPNPFELERFLAIFWAISPPDLIFKHSKMNLFRKKRRRIASFFNSDSSSLYVTVSGEKIFRKSGGLPANTLITNGSDSVNNSTSNSDSLPTVVHADILDNSDSEDEFSYGISSLENGKGYSTTDLFQEIASLNALRVLVRTGGGIALNSLSSNKELNPLNEKSKWKATISFDVILKLAAEIDFPIETFLQL